MKIKLREMMLLLKLYTIFHGFKNKYIIKNKII